MHDKTEKTEKCQVLNKTNSNEKYDCGCAINNALWSLFTLKRTQIVLVKKFQFWCQNVNYRPQRLVCVFFFTGRSDVYCFSIYNTCIYNTLLNYSYFTLVNLEVCGLWISGNCFARQTNEVITINKKILINSTNLLLK